MILPVADLPLGEPELPHESDESSHSQARATPQQEDVGRQAYGNATDGTTDTDRLAMARESLRLLQDLRAAVESKQRAIDGFLADLDARIGRSEDWMARMTVNSEPR